MLTHADFEFVSSESLSRLSTWVTRARETPKCRASAARDSNFPESSKAL